MYAEFDKIMIRSFDNIVVRPIFILHEEYNLFSVIRNKSKKTKNQKEKKLKERS
jgi:hypothetical protein